MTYEFTEEQRAYLVKTLGRKRDSLATKVAKHGDSIRTSLEARHALITCVELYRCLDEVGKALDLLACLTEQELIDDLLQNLKNWGGE